MTKEIFSKVSIEMQRTMVLTWLRVLAYGCKEHPSYRAKREPRVDCSDCKTIWSSRQNLIMADELDP